MGPASSLPLAVHKNGDEKVVQICNLIRRIASVARQCSIPKITSGLYLFILFFCFHFVFFKFIYYIIIFPLLFLRFHSHLHRCALTYIYIYAHLTNRRYDIGLEASIWLLVHLGSHSRIAYVLTLAVDASNNIFDNLELDQQSDVLSLVLEVSQSVRRFVSDLASLVNLGEGDIGNFIQRWMMLRITQVCAIFHLLVLDILFVYAISIYC